MYQDVSARAIAAFSTAGFARDPGWTIDIDELARRLADAGLPCFDAALLAEDDVGGYALPGGKMRHGVFAGLGRLDGTIRWTPKLLAQGGGGALLPVRYEHGAGEPSVWIDDTGTLWLAMEEVPSVPAYDDVRQYLEVLAIGLHYTEPGRSHHLASEARMESLSAQLGLAPVEEASGRHVRAWAGEETCLVISDTPGFKAGTLVITRSPRVAALVREAMSQGGKPITSFGPAKAGGAGRERSAPAP